MRALLILLLVLPALLPSASAQTAATVRAEPLAEPVPPGGESTTVVVVRVPCSSLRAGSGAATVTLSAAAVPPWATLRFEPAELRFDVAACGGADDAALEEESVVTVATSPTAPALSPARVRVLADVRDAPAHRAEATLEVSAAYRGALDVVVLTPRVEAEPQRVLQFEVRVTNRGNAPTKVTFAAEAPERWQVPLPQPVVAAAAGEKGSTVTIPINVMGPFYNGRVDERAAITLRYTSTHALEPELEGDSGAVTMEAVVSGNYAPLPAALAAVAVVAAAALARGSRPPRWPKD